MAWATCALAFQLQPATPEMLAKVQLEGAKKYVKVPETDNVFYFNKFLQESV